MGDGDSPGMQGRGVVGTGHRSVPPQGIPEFERCALCLSPFEAQHCLTSSFCAWYLPRSCLSRPHRLGA